MERSLVESLITDHSCLSWNATRWCVFYGQRSIPVTIVLKISNLSCQVIRSILLQNGIVNCDNECQRWTPDVKTWLKQKPWITIDKVADEMNTFTRGIHCQTFRQNLRSMVNGAALASMSQRKERISGWNSDWRRKSGPSFHPWSETEFVWVEASRFPLCRKADSDSVLRWSGYRALRIHTQEHCNYCEAIKRPEKLKKGAILLCVTKYRITKGLLEKFKWKIWQRLSYEGNSTDLSPCDFHVFGAMKTNLASRGHYSGKSPTNEVQQWQVGPNFCNEGIKRLVP